MASCILPGKLDEYRKAIKDKKLDVLGLMKMSTEERTAEFAKFAGAEAPKVNTLFEEKLVLKNRLQGLKNFINKTAELKQYSKAGKENIAKVLSEYRAKQQERIFSPAEHETFLNDLADKLIGTHISREVAGRIFELGAKADALKDTNPNLSGVNDEYFKAKQALNDYVKSQEPVAVLPSVLKDLATIGRNNLLLNPATPIKASISQLGNSVMDFVSRRFAAGTVEGGNKMLVDQANKEAWDTFLKTGLNTAAMESLDDTHVLNKGENFKVPADANVGEKTSLEMAHAISTLAKWSNKVAIDWEHNFAFTKFYQKTFFDMLNVTSSDFAKLEGLSGEEAKARSAEIFKDALRIEPKTEEGKTLRAEAQRQAARITSTNDTLVSRISVAAKNALNKAYPGFPLGDFIIPMAKIPANVIANGIDNAGAGVPVMLKDFYQGAKRIQSEDMKTRLQGMAQMRNAVQRAIRIGGTLGVAFLMASQMKKDDFKEDKFGNSFVRIAGEWINTEYISMISPALAGAMMAKGMDLPGDKAIAYVHGALEGLKRVPGADELAKIRDAITGNNMAKSVSKYVSDFASSRSIPRFLSNVFNRFPLPPTADALRDNIPTRLFFGGTGVRTDAQMIYDNSKKDWSKDTGKEITAFRQNAGEAKFKEASDKFDEAYRAKIEGLVKAEQFNNLSEADQHKLLVEEKDKIRDSIFREYNFHYRKEHHNRLPRL